MQQQLPKMILITDEAVAHRNGKSCVSTIATAVNYAAAHDQSVLLQIRNKQLLEPAFHKYVQNFLKRLAPLAERPPVIVVNEFLDEVNSGVGQLPIAGVHRPAEPLDGLSAAAIRAKHPNLLLGVSCHNTSELQAASCADYVTYSPIFMSRSKPGYGPVVGVELLERVVSETDVPVFALGGIDPANAKSAMKSGCYGLAVMGGLFRTSNVERYMDAIIAAISS